MKLDEFIAQTLEEIVHGVQSAQEQMKGKGAAINPPDYVATPTASTIYKPLGGGKSRTGQFVDFDIAVTTGEDKQAKGGVGVFVAPLTLGSQVQRDNTSSTVSRIKFSVALFLPEKDYA